MQIRCLGLNCCVLRRLRHCISLLLVVIWGLYCWIWLGVTVILACVVIGVVILCCTHSSCSNCMMRAFWALHCWLLGRMDAVVLRYGWRNDFVYVVNCFCYGFVVCRHAWICFFWLKYARCVSCLLFILLHLTLRCNDFSCVVIGVVVICLYLTVVFPIIRCALVALWARAQSLLQKTILKLLLIFVRVVIYVIWLLTMLHDCCEFSVCYCCVLCVFLYGSDMVLSFVRHLVYGAW